MRVPKEYSECVQYAPTPAWVLDYPIDFNVPANEVDRNAGIINVLSDSQHHLEERSLYQKIVRKLSTQAGVQWGSRLQVCFSPELDRLLIHRLVLYRNQQAIDLLQIQEIQVLSREDDTDWHVFAGNLTAVLLLKDTRVGDVIDFSYSIQNKDSIVNERSHGTFPITGTMALQAVRRRLLYGTERKVFTLAINSASQPTATYTDDGMIDCRWDTSHQKAVTVEPGIPSWFTPFAWIEYTEFATWNEVAKWACALFYNSSEDSLSPEFEELIESIQSRGDSFEEQVRLALRFVQDDIRYVAIGATESAQKPHDSSTVMDRRYGDCKDKALLLSNLLRCLGIEALPALVHTRHKQMIAQSLPRPSVFNHVIVKVREEGSVYWLDPTITGQQGILSKITCPPYGKALVIHPESQELEDVATGNAQQSIAVHESFKIHHGQTPADLTVARVYEGSHADAMRKRIANSNHELLEKQFFEEYLRLYPGIILGKPWSCEDELDNNKLVLSLDYKVAKVWNPVPHKRGDLVGFFYASGIQNALYRPESSTRHLPFAIPYPLQLESNLEVRLLKSFRLDRKNTIIECESFIYKGFVEMASNLFSFKMQFVTKKDNVHPKEMARYLKSIEQVAFHFKHAITINEYRR